MPPKKWTAVWQDNEKKVDGRLEVGSVEFISDFRDVAMVAPAFQTRLSKHGESLKIFVGAGDALRELQMKDSVSELESFGDDYDNPIRIVLPPESGKLF